MKKFTKQIIVGITVGACLLGGGFGAYTASAAADNTKEHVRPGTRQMPQINKEEFAAKIAKDFGVKQSEVLKAVNENTDLRDIGHAAMLAKISGKSFASVLSMKSDWRDVEKKLGITKEDIRKEQIRATALRIAANSDIESSLAEKLLGDGYSPIDIEIAARIANASGNDVNTVLAARKINNQWRDVAKEFGVDEQALRQGRHFRDGKPGFYRGDNHRKDAPHFGDKDDHDDDKGDHDDKE